MKKKSLIACSVTLLLMLLTAPAFAALAVWTDSNNLGESPVYLSGSGQNNYHFELDITKTGFDPGLDEVDSYALTIALDDDGDRGGEWAYINLPGLVSDRIIRVNGEDYSFNMSLQGLADLNQTGVLDVSIYAFWGDFYYIGSQLEASGNSSVPLPASILLLGTGLLGLSGLRRFRKSSY